MQLKKGQTLKGGKYTIRRVLGQGGFGITYLAVTTDNQEVAIKEFFMKDACIRDTDSMHVSVPSVGAKAEVERYKLKFIKEAKNLLQLRHPNIVQVFEAFEENGTFYYVMQYMAGGSLRDNVLRFGPMDEFTAKSYIMQIASALRYMHEQKHICHYDVKPGNITIDNEGQAMLIDFGLSKNYDGAGQQTSSTPVGISAGYAPIEQYQQSLMEFSPATDVYALGATLYFLLSGQNPPEASVVLEKGINCPVKMSKNTWDAIRLAMIPSRQERLQTMADFCKTLELGAQPQPPQPKKRNGWAWVVAAFVAALLVTFIINIANENSKTATPIMAEEDKKTEEKVVEEKPEVEQPFATRYVSQTNQRKLAKAEVIIDYPMQGPEPLVKAIRNYIIKELSSESARYSGDMNDGDAVALYYAKKYVAAYADDDELNDYESETTAHLTKLSETDRFITYQVEMADYGGGAMHGMNSTNGVTFRKSDGKIIKNILKNTNSSDFKQMVVNDVGAHHSVEDIMNSFKTDFKDDPLPSSDLFLSREGVELRYQPYEIASYGEGVIAVTLQWWEVKNYLTDEARALCPVQLE